MKRAALITLLSAAACSPAPAPPSQPADTVLRAPDPRCAVAWTGLGLTPADHAAAALRADRVKAARTRISLDAKDRMFWRDTPVEEIGLRQFLEQEMTVAPQPLLIVQADRNASCATLKTMIARIMESRFCHQPEYCVFDWAEIPADLKRGPREYVQGRGPL